MSIVGSYANGFAPRDGNPLYLDLWRGCIGAWAPCLGLTGVTLRDWSGAKNHGTLTSMTIANAWQANQGRYGLSFDGSDDWVSIPDINQRPTEFTISAWVYLPTSPGDFDCVFTSWGQAAFLFTVMSTAKVRMYVNGNLTGYRMAETSNSITIGRWTHIFGRVSTTLQTVAVGINAVQEGSTSWSSSISYGSATAGQIGRYETFGYGNFVLDDIRMYNRMVSNNEMQILASRRGIAYDLAPRRRSRVFGGFRAAWAARKAQIIGGGLN